MQKSPNFLQVFLSVLAALIGVQNNKNRERDFKYGKFWKFLLAGAIISIIFVALLIMATDWLFISGK